MAEIDDFNADLNYEAEVGDGAGDNEEADGGEAEMMVHEYYFLTVFKHYNFSQYPKYFKTFFQN